MLEVDINFAAPDPNDCPATLVELVAILDTLITGTVIGDFLPYVVSTATPGSDDQDKVWHRLDTNGKPIGAYIFYNGAWRSSYTGRLGEITMYSGDPSFDFDDEGRGKLEGDDGATGEWDGWHLCNSQNGTPDLRDKFIVGGRTYTDGEWTSTVSGVATSTGGVKDITLDSINTYVAPLPASPNLFTIPYTRVGNWSADGQDTGTGLFGLPRNDETDHFLVPDEVGNPTPPAIPTLPPYFTCAYAIFVGYET